jgi:DNA-binding response OmpR family regulator
MTTERPVTVLVVDDNPATRYATSRVLRSVGLDVLEASTGREALALALEGPSLIVLDIHLPDLDGFEVCRRLRSASTVPIIVVSARGEEADRVIGLELGADDYLVKPFGLRELVARIRAVTRRTASAAVDAPPTVEGSQRLGELEIDRRAHKVLVGGEPIDLTPKEFALLALLAEDAGAVRTRGEILDQVWDPHWYGPTKTLDVHVASLRKKLGDPGIIETVRGVGFRVRDDAEAGPRP